MLFTLSQILLPSAFGLAIASATAKYNKSNHITTAGYLASELDRITAQDIAKE